VSRNLRGPLQALLEEPHDEKRIEAVRARLRVSRGLPERAAPRWRAWSAIGVLAACAALGLWRSGGAGEAVATPSSPRAHDEAPRLARVDGAPFESLRGDAEGARVALADGSVVTLDADVSVDVVENLSERLVLAQGRGRVQYDVRPGGPRRWTIDAGLASIDVLGTQFVIERMIDSVRIEVTRGHVRVRSDTTLETLGAGESRIVRAAQAMPPAPAALPVEPALVEHGQPSRSTSAHADPGPPPASTWRDLAARGAHDEAFAALGEPGFEAATTEARSATDLLALADLARLSGHPALAVIPLERISAEHADDPRAGAAALTLGRVELDVLGSPEAAITALERASELGVPTGLAGTLQARLAEAYRRVGRTGEAHAAAARYLADAPEGVSADEMRAILAAPE
jgi:transmembrane sensor